jgi:kinesin family protein 5
MDLLQPGVNRCQIREDTTHGLWITDATAIPVATADDCLRLMAIGDKNRVVASTRQNIESSRSHSVFIVSIAKQNVLDRSESVSQLYLVDLAGSESVDKTGSEGQRLEEAKYINTSLLALRNVIRALVQGTPHVPYRDSKITRLLQNSFGGNSKTFLIVCCSPAAYNQRETVSSLRFGDSTGQIQNQPVQNVFRSVEELTRLLKQTNSQVAEARDRIRQLERLLEMGPDDYEDDEDDAQPLCKSRSVVDEKSEEVPAAFVCPLSKRIMMDPVVAMDGYTYEEHALSAYFLQYGCTPGLNGEPGLADLSYIPNLALRDQIAQYNGKLYLDPG